jgi:hypothetical protein
MDIGQFDLYRNDKRSAIKPLWSHPGWKTDKGFIEWFYQQLPIFEEIHEARICRHINNVLWYTGEYDGNTEYRLIYPERGVQSVPKYLVPVVINHLYDLTEQRVAALAVNKPNFNVRAHNDDEAGDRTAATHMKTMISSVRRVQRFDAKITDLDRWCGIFGEAFIGFEWDESLGEVIKGKPIGDIRVSLKEPFWIMYEPKRDFDKVNCLIEIYDILHVEEVKKKYKLKDLKNDGTNSLWSFDNGSLYSKDADQVVIYRYLEKPNEFNPDGCEIYLAGNQVLDRKDEWKYEHKDFPYERVTDIDVPGKVFPISYYNFLIPLQHQYNKMTSMMHRSITMFAHAKWFMTRGACKPESLGNSSTIVQVAPGAPNPKLEVFPAVSQDIFRYRDTMRSEMAMIGATQGVSRGEPPPGARAASMLKFYEEQEMQRRGTTVDKRNELIRRAYAKIGSLVQQYYPKNPARVVRHIGKSHRYDLLRLEEVNINSPYDIDIENASAFSESKSARMEEVAFLLEKIPGSITPEQAADILGVSSPEKFYDVTTAALKKAESENSDFIDGRTVMTPEPYEDLLIHRKIHLIAMQGDSFKKLPDLLKKAFILHVDQTEQLMYERAMKSPGFAQLLAQLPDFPVFADPQIIPSPQPSQQPGQEQPQQEGEPKQRGRPPKEASPEDLGQAVDGGTPAKLEIKPRARVHLINHPKHGKMTITSKDIA